MEDHRSPPARRWQSHLLGLREFPEELADFELDHFFTYEPAAHKAIMSRRSPAHRLAVAVHIGFVRMTGRSLDAFERLPVAVIAKVKRELNIRGPDLASMRTLYSRRRTLFEHQRWAAKVAGFQPLNDRRKRVLLTQLKAAAKSTLSNDRLVQAARQWLYDTRILIPGERTLLDLARRAQTSCQNEMLRMVKESIPGRVRTRWRAELLSEHPSYGTTLGWLQQPPRRRSRKTTNEVMAKIDFLKELHVDDYSLTGISLEQQRAYARRVRRSRPAKWAEVKEPRRTLEMVCFLRVTLMQLTDVFLQLASMSGAAIFRRATDQVVSERMTPRDAYRRLREIRHLADDTNLDANQLRERIRELAPAELRHGALAAATRRRLSESARQTRPLLKTMLKLELRSTPGAPLTAALDVVRNAYATERATLPADADAGFAPRWKELIEDRDRRLAMRSFEAATVQQLRKGLRNGTVWVDESLKYRNRDDILLSEAVWGKTRVRHYRRLRLPQSAKRHVAPLLSGIDAGLAALAEAVNEERVCVDDDQLHLQALEKEDKPDGVEQTRQRLTRAIGPAQLPDMIVEMDSRVRFSWEILGRPAHSESELLAIYAALLAHGMGTTATATALMVPGVSSATIATAMEHLSEHDALAKANALLVEFLQSQPLTELWGAGTMASSDAMSLEASRHLWSARVDPRRRRYAVGMYTHVLDQWGIIYDQPLVLSERQAGAALEGMMRQTASVELEQLAVDTHGYTDFAMGLSNLLGFDLCPRLKNLKLRRLHLPPDGVAPQALERLVDRDVHLDVIADGWDGLVRVAASIESGCTSATVALERFGSASRGDPIYEAGAALGRLRRTLFLCDFCSNAVFRREVLRVLNYGESVHALQRAIHSGRIAVSRGRRSDELVAISGSLALLSNLVMAWTAYHMQTVLEEWRRKGSVVPDKALLRHIAPVHFSGINFRGLFHFPIRRHSHRLLLRAAPEGKRENRRK